MEALWRRIDVRANGLGWWRHQSAPSAVGERTRLRESRYDLRLRYPVAHQARSAHNNRITRRPKLRNRRAATGKKPAQYFPTSLDRIGAGARCLVPERLLPAGGDRS